MATKLHQELLLKYNYLVGEKIMTEIIEFAPVDDKSQTLNLLNISDVNTFFEIVVDPKNKAEQQFAKKYHYFANRASLIEQVKSLILTNKLQGRDTTLFDVQNAMCGFTANC